MGDDDAPLAETGTDWGDTRSARIPKSASAEGACPPASVEGECLPASVGVLALQGGFEAHARVLRGLGAAVREVRVPADLDGLDGLVIPGGESTTMTLGIAREGLAEPLRELCGPPPGGRGVPVLGSCAGLILLDRDHLGLMDVRARRNAFGCQTRSFEAEVRMRGVSDPPAPPGSDPPAPPGSDPPAPPGSDPPARPLRGVFIRAPWIAEHGPGVEILAEVDGHPVAAREGDRIAVAFHAELTDDERVHRLFLDAVRRRRARGTGLRERVPPSRE